MGTFDISLRSQSGFDISLAETAGEVVGNFFFIV